MTEQLAEAAALTRSRLDESTASWDGRLQRQNERLSASIEAVEASGQVVAQEVAQQLTEMAAAVDGQVERGVESMASAVHSGTEAAVSAVSQLEKQVYAAREQQEERAAAQQAAEAGWEEAFNAVVAELGALRGGVEAHEVEVERRVSEASQAVVVAQAALEGMRTERATIDGALSQIRESIATGSDGTAALKEQMKGFREEMTRAAAE